MSTTVASDVQTAEAGRILVVDDSRVVRAAVASMLRPAGYMVREAEDGQTALRCLESQAYDVVVTDLRMPELDGFGVLEAVKQRCLNTEVIILTGTHGQDVNSAIRALRLGAHDFLTKPPSRPEEVILTVERALEKKRLKEANLRLLRELEALSRTDALTGALNRRVFDETLRQEVSRAVRHDLDLSLLLLDLDHFKTLNDTYGHRAGDEVLKLCVRQMSAVFRVNDGIYRYGGEEFAVLMPHVPLQGALVAARRMVALVAHSPVPVESARIRVTVSAGVVSGRGSQLNACDLVALADKALYAAKDAGRNRAQGVGCPGRPRRVRAA